MHYLMDGWARKINGRPFNPIMKTFSTTLVNLGITGNAYQVLRGHGNKGQGQINPDTFAGNIPLCSQSTIQKEMNKLKKEMQIDLAILQANMKMLAEKTTDGRIIGISFDEKKLRDDFSGKLNFTSFCFHHFIRKFSRCTQLCQLLLE